jgi:hypothetical protein
MKWITDVFIALGLALIFIGLWLIYPPAALIVLGVLLLAAGILGGWMASGLRRRQ